MNRWMRLPLAVSVGAVVVSGGCDSSSEPSAQERCEEIQSEGDPAQAWEDIRVLQEDISEYLALDCARLLDED